MTILGTLRVRLDWTRSNAKQPKFDVIDSSRKVETGSQPFGSCRWRQILVASRPVLTHPKSRDRDLAILKPTKNGHCCPENLLIRL